VIDDSVENASLISFHLQEEGYRVITASNGEDGIKIALLMRPKIILMDIAMPILDGLAATTKIRENEVLRDVPVIAITAFGAGGFRRAAYNAGFDGYLTKPIDFERLRELIAALLSKADAGPPEAQDSEKM
jgi:two-component system cell cycle response regulator DivK